MENEVFTYLMFDGTYYKIGKSKNPEKRLKQIKTGNPKTKLICFGVGVTEKYLHTRFFRSRNEGEWFFLNKIQVEKIIELIKYGENYIDNNNKRKYKFLLTYDTEVFNMNNGLLKSEKLSEKYIINFGKYKGTPIKEMVTEEQFKYCKWIYNEMKKDMSRQEKSVSRKYKAFNWLIQNFEKLNNITKEKKYSL